MTSRINDVTLVGKNVQTALCLLTLFAERLMNDDARIPKNIILVGSPGTGKTALALYVASLAKCPCFQLNSPKDSFVGGTERKSNLQQWLREQYSPNVCYVDEITEAFDLERNSLNTDGGASKAVIASWLSALSNDKIKSILIGSTNCPWRMGAAMRSRLVFIPVLYPFLEDFPNIIKSIVKQINCNAEVLDIEAFENNSSIYEASKTFYKKGATPRHIKSAITNSYFFSGKITEKEILDAADDLIVPIDFKSTIYSDLWALKVTSHRSYLPWRNGLQNIKLPEHLSDVVDSTTGDILYDALNDILSEYERKNNVNV